MLVGGGDSGSSGGGLIAVCGDSMKAAGEACDDGNTVTETRCPDGVATCTACDAACSSVLSLPPVPC